MQFLQYHVTQRQNHTVTETILIALTASTHTARVEPGGKKLWHVLVDDLEHSSHLVAGALEECERSMGNHLVVAINLHVNLFSDGMAYRRRLSCYQYMQLVRQQLNEQSIL